MLYHPLMLPSPPSLPRSAAAPDRIGNGAAVENHAKSVRISIGCLLKMVFLSPRSARIREKGVCAAAAAMMHYNMGT
jgi:hypothetical protein